MLLDTVFEFGWVIFKHPTKKIFWFDLVFDFGRLIFANPTRMLTEKSFCTIWLFFIGGHTFL